MSQQHETILPAGVQLFESQQPFVLESGAVLPELQLAYHTYGQLNARRDNVIWVCHALTANSDVAEWWKGLVGAGCGLDTDQYFIICVNVLGSYYGSTSPRFIDPRTGEAYGLSFPICTVRDVARSFVLLYNSLGIKGIQLAIGGSFGAHQVMEMAFTGLPIRRLMLIANSARETAWSIAIHEAQRMVMETDPIFSENKARQNNAGIRAARAIGLLTYRTISNYLERQTDEDDEKIDGFKAASYMRHQGQKLDQRYHIHCYWYITKCLDSHHVGRGRGGIKAALSQIEIPTIVVSIPTDMLIPPVEQSFLAQHIPHARLLEMPSELGHDGFLIEIDQTAKIIMDFLTEETITQ